MQSALNIDGERARIPSDIYDHEGFRAWARSGDVPAGTRVAFVEGEVWIEMSPESIESHSKPKGEITAVLWRLVEDRDLGEAFPDRVLLSHPGAKVSTEPDFVFASWDAFASGRIRLIEKANRPDDYIELEGSPDLVVEIVSDTSVDKDTVALLKGYFRAGVREYWLIDARGEIRFQIYRRGPEGFVAAAPLGGGAQVSAVLGAAFALTRAKNRLGRWRYTLTVSA